MEWILGLINSIYIHLFYIHGNRLREITVVNLAQKSESAPTAGFHSQLLSVLCLYNVNEFQTCYRECVLLGECEKPRAQIKVLLFEEESGNKGRIRQTCL